MLRTYVAKYVSVLQTLCDGNSLNMELSGVKLAHAVIIAVIVVKYNIFMMINYDAIITVCQALLVEPDIAAKSVPDYERLIQFHFPTPTE